MSLSLSRPGPTEYNPDYGKYIALVGEENPLEALRSGRESMLGLLAKVSEADSLIKHAPYTWSIKEVIGHLVDSERIFAYRALRIARGDSTPLPGFEENDYVRVAGFDRQPLADLASEFDTVRRSTLSLLESLDEEAWERRGVANGSAISVRALAFILAGHERHHGGIIKARLGVS
jgi:hypothetical protein